MHAALAELQKDYKAIQLLQMTGTMYYYRTQKPNVILSEALAEL